MESQRLDPPADRTPEEIERDMAQTRESITEKVAALESQVMSTVQTAADTVTNTVQAVKEIVTTGPGALGDTVKTSLSSVGEVVKEQLDFTKKIRDNPWEAALTAVAAGFATGLIAFGRRPIPPVAHQTSEARNFAAPPPSQQPPAPREPGMFDGIWNNIRAEVTQLCEEAWKTASQSLRDAVHTQVPTLVKTTVETGAEGLTNRLKDHV